MNNYYYMDRMIDKDSNLVEYYNFLLWDNTDLDNILLKDMMIYKVDNTENTIYYFV